MVDVGLIPLNALDYLYFRWQSSDLVLPTSEVQGNESSASFDAQGRIDMAVARENAAFVALGHLGFPVRLQPSRVVVYASFGPASGVLRSGEIVESVAGHLIRTISSLKDVLRSLRSGERVKVVVEPLAGGRRRDALLRLGSLVKSPNASFQCVRSPTSTSSRSAQPCIGIQVQQLGQVVGAPFHVNVNAEGIIGPSAGLAFTLGLIDVLGRRDLAHGLTIGATGTISPDGTVGDVGGVAQKTLAVERAGASVFFVPRPEYDVAKRYAGRRLKIIAVSSVDQAITALQMLSR